MESESPAVEIEAADNAASVEVAEAQADAAETVADSAVEIARINADRDVTIAAIEAETDDEDVAWLKSELASLHARCDAATAANSSLQNRMTELETAMAALTTATVATAETVEASIQPLHSEAPIAEAVEVTAEAPAEAIAPPPSEKSAGQKESPEVRVRKKRWL